MELIKGPCLREDGAYLKVKEINYINLQNFDIVNKNMLHMPLDLGNYEIFQYFN